MKLVYSLPCLALLLALPSQSLAAQRQHDRGVSAVRAHPASPQKPTPSPDPPPAPSTDSAPKDSSDALDFDFFGQEQAASAGPAATGEGSRLHLDDPDVAAAVRTRRWMLTTHQTLGITTWALMAATTVVGQLNYHELYGGGGGSLKYQSPHRWLALSTGVAFVTTAGFSIFAPSPYAKPLRLDTGLLHRIAVLGATAGMVTQAVLGWITARQAEAGNPNHLRTYARTHQVVGYTTLAFLSVAGAVWLF
jgi:hypothetical protein